MRSARDLGAPGLDSVYGAGKLLLPEPPDVVAPAAKAHVSTGQRGRTLRLLSTVSDDPGEMSVIEQIKAETRTVATIKRDSSVSVSDSRNRRHALEGPATAVGAYRHCVRAADRGGNADPLSCAKLIPKRLPRVAALSGS